MQDFLVMRDFGKTKPPTVEKVRRDGENMYCESRYVIVLNEEGAVVETIDRQTEYTGNFLVVLAPVTYDGEFLPLCVVLEIGLSRSVPYQQFEKKFTNHKFAIKSRRPIAKLNDKTIIYLLNKISVALQQIVDADTAHWQNLVHYTKMTPDGKLAKGGKVVSSGKFITVPKDEDLIIYICLLININARSKGHLHEFVQITKEKLVRLPFASYPKKDLKRLKVAQEIAYVLGEAKYPKLFLEIILDKLGKPGTKFRNLVEEIIDYFQIPINEDDPDKFIVAYLKLHEIYEDHGYLVSKFKTEVVTHPKRENRKKNYKYKGKPHGKEHMRLEILPSKEAISKKHCSGSQGGKPIINFPNGTPESMPKT